MKISFLVTYYNQHEYVNKSLDSILKIHKDCDWEILVGDDGSSDGTVEIVRQYIEQYPQNIRLYVMDRDSEIQYSPVRRASANRLNLLKHAEGDFFCTLDGDDYYCDEEFVKDAIRIFEQNDNVSIVAFGLRYVRDGVEGDGITLPENLTNKVVDKIEYLENYYLPAGACVHRICWPKDRITEIEKIGYFDDNDIVINSLKYGEIYAVNRPVYAYRQTGKSVYTAMDGLEQAVLNVQGLDVDIQLVGPEYREALIKRNATQIIMMYCWKKRLQKILGEMKYRRYLAEAEELTAGMLEGLTMSASIMKYDTLSKKNRNEIRALVWKMKKRNPRYALKIFCKYLLGVI